MEISIDDYEFKYRPGDIVKLNIGLVGMISARIYELSYDMETPIMKYKFHIMFNDCDSHITRIDLIQLDYEDIVIDERDISKSIDPLKLEEYVSREKKEVEKEYLKNKMEYLFSKIKLANQGHAVTSARRPALNPGSVYAPDYTSDLWYVYRIEERLKALEGLRSSYFAYYFRPVDDNISHGSFVSSLDDNLIDSKRFLRSDVNVVMNIY